MKTTTLAVFFLLSCLPVVQSLGDDGSCKASYRRMPRFDESVDESWGIAFSWITIGCQDDISELNDEEIEKLRATMRLLARDYALILESVLKLDLEREKFVRRLRTESGVTCVTDVFIYDFSFSERMPRAQ